MHESRTITPYPPKLEGFQTCVWMGSFSSPLWQFLHPSRVVPVCQAEWLTQASVSEDSVSAQSAEILGTDIELLMALAALSQPGQHH